MPDALSRRLDKIILPTVSLGLPILVYLMGTTPLFRAGDPALDFC